jgi:hypothetical protein
MKKKLFKFSWIFTSGSNRVSESGLMPSEQYFSDAMVGISYIRIFNKIRMMSTLTKMLDRFL